MEERKDDTYKLCDPELEKAWILQMEDGIYPESDILEVYGGRPPIFSRKFVEFTTSLLFQDLPRWSPMLVTLSKGSCDNLAAIPWRYLMPKLVEAMPRSCTVVYELLANWKGSDVLDLRKCFVSFSGVDKMRTMDMNVVQLQCAGILNVLAGGGVLFDRDRECSNTFAECGECDSDGFFTGSVHGMEEDVFDVFRRLLDSDDQEARLRTLHALLHVVDNYSKWKGHTGRIVAAYFGRFVSQDEVVMALRVLTESIDASACPVLSHVFEKLPEKLECGDLKVIRVVCGFLEVVMSPDMGQFLWKIVSDVMVPLIKCTVDAPFCVKKSVCSLLIILIDGFPKNKLVKIVRMGGLRVLFDGLEMDEESCSRVLRAVYTILQNCRGIDRWLEEARPLFLAIGNIAGSENVNTCISRDIITLVNSQFNPDAFT